MGKEEERGRESASDLASEGCAWKRWREKSRGRGLKGERKEKRKRTSAWREKVFSFVCSFRRKLQTSDNKMGSRCAARVYCPRWSGISGWGATRLVNKALRSYILNSDQCAQTGLW
eukprot:477235-Rhodomonas_salina.1